MVFLSLIARSLHRIHLNRIKLSPEGNRICSDVHVVLPENATRYRRILIVGDIHGCYGELRNLLDRCYFRPGVDLLLQVGDLVNKGPGSPEVLEMVRECGILAVRGNHDDAALAAYRDCAAGKPLKKSKYAWVKSLDPKLADVMNKLPFSISLPAYGVVVVHAGMLPGRPLAEQNLKDLLTMRDVVPRSELTAQQDAPPSESEDDKSVSREAVTASANTIEWDWEQVIKEAAEKAQQQRSSTSDLQIDNKRTTQGDLLSQIEASERKHPAGRAWASVWKGPNHVFFGHDAGRRLQMEEFATGLDGGCVYGGTLYAALLPALDEAGNPVTGRAGVPEDAHEFQLGTGTVGYLVGVQASVVHSPP